jgi:hypothetical protein
MASFKLGVGNIPVFLPSISGVEFWVKISPRRFDLCVLLGDAAISNLGCVACVSKCSALRHDQAISTENIKPNKNNGVNVVCERFDKEARRERKRKAFACGTWGGSRIE